MSTLNIILIILGALSVAVPSIELKRIKKDNKLKELTTVSKRMLWISLSLIIFGTINYFVSENEKSQDRVSIRADLTDSFKIALETFNSKLTYDPASGKIVTNNIQNNVQNGAQRGLIVGNFNVGTKMSDITIYYKEVSGADQVSSVVPNFDSIVPFKTVIRALDSFLIAYNTLTNQFIYYLLVIPMDFYMQKKSTVN